MPAHHEVVEPAWSEQLPHLLWRAQQSMQRLLNEGLEGIGVSINQLGLAGRLDENGAMSAADLARAHHITPQSVTTAMAALERAGWIVRRPHPVHKRVVLLELTALGNAGVAEGRRVIKEADSLISRAIGTEQAEAFAANLRMITAVVDGPDTPAGRMWPEPPR